VWWSCSLSVDPACRVHAGANRAAWMALGGASDPQENGFAPLAQSIEKAAQARFGALVTCTSLGILEESPAAGARVSIAIGGLESDGAMCWILSPELIEALGGEDIAAGPFDANRMSQIKMANADAPVAANPLDILQHLEIPVSVLFGRAHMRLKDLLGLANGSVVHLDRELGDEVEVRVNNCMIARGEVVAVDGNYGVRILRMVSGEKTAPTEIVAPGDQKIGSTK
jgi:flagellar motor switch protein FliN/FliY